MLARMGAKPGETPEIREIPLKLKIRKTSALPNVCVPTSPLVPGGMTRLKSNPNLTSLHFRAPDRRLNYGRKTMLRNLRAGAIAAGVAMMATGAMAATECVHSKWGKDDTHGSANLMTPEMTLKAAALIKSNHSRWAS